ncbi:MAG: PIN domain-containing protein [Pseudomonadota bacterium]
MRGDACFFDSNVVLYSQSVDPKKRAVARRLIGKGGCISVQALNECANVLRRRYQYDIALVGAFTKGLCEMMVVHAVTEETHHFAIQIMGEFRLATYDALIVSSAIESGAQILYSEDMHNGLRIGELTIVDPFKA